ncbi:MAG: replication-associated recombination protein A [Syntrophorhabdaceae bacterium]|nr:replication-associated recombination protein A [Syntrophorhabdaceae bacterium]MDI9560407.1 replication-associated recombination protein A [Pseudomonadota bacterium]
MELFKDSDFKSKDNRKPLADRMRPESLDDFVGQEHLLGKDKLLRVLIEKRGIPSIILWGPSGVGKTTIGWIIGKETGLPFVPMSAVSIGLKEVKEVIKKTKLQKIILFVDEFHRFNKLQQDSFLPHVENGDIILIGATTENPSFEIISPLLSRMKVLTLNPLSNEEIITIIKRALNHDQELKDSSIVIEEHIIEELAMLANGDARKALNLLEICYKITKEDDKKKRTIGRETLKEALQRNIAVYDKKREMHYDLISALHKSMRGSNPDASLYWLARMIEGGEDPLYILRRMVRFASEDIGNVDPHALTLAISATEAFKFIGPPEGYLAIAQLCVYLSLCEKGNAIYKAYNTVMHDVRTLPEYPVPLHIRNAPTKLMAQLGYGEGYLYPHDYTNAIVKQGYFPEQMKNKRYYHPTDRGYEKRLKEFMEKVRKLVNTEKEPI